MRDRLVKFLGNKFFGCIEFHRDPEFRLWVREIIYPRAERFFLVATVILLFLQFAKTSSFLHLLAAVVIAALWFQRSEARRRLSLTSALIADARAVLSPYTTCGLYEDSIEIERILNKAHGIVNPVDRARLVEMNEADEKQSRLDPIRDLREQSRRLEVVK